MTGRFHKAGIAVLGALAWAALAGPVQAIITYNDLVPPQTPNNSVVGQWGTNAGLVAISPDFAITTIHQSVPLGQSISATYAASMAAVYFNGIPYYPQLVDWGGGAGQTADIRIVRLYSDSNHTTPANLTQYVGLYSTPNETSLSQVVLGGMGRTRGAALTTSGGVVYGYQWGGTADNNNGIHWATNTISTTQYMQVVNSSDRSYEIGGDFTPAGTTGATTYEGMSADHDSGGGVFGQVNGQWYVMGLLNLVTTHTPGAAWFNPPDQFYAAQVSSYANWIYTTVNAVDGETLGLSPIPGDANLDRKVNFADYVALSDHWLTTTGNSWATGDFNGDGIVNFKDYVELSDYWLTTIGSLSPSGLSTAPAPPAPEPATLALMALGALGLIRRKRA